MITDELRKWLYSNGLVIVPKVPTEAMMDAVAAAGHVGDGGGRESGGFEEEWSVAVDYWVTGHATPGLITLVRPWLYGEPEPSPEEEALAASIYPRAA